MNTDPLSGLLLISLGALSAASFYVPFAKVKNMAWEVYWLIGGFFSWIVVPIIVAIVTIPNLFALYRTVSAGTLWWTFFFGFLYGFGGLTFGLSMRYLGLSLGYALTLGIIAVFGTLIPPLVNGIIFEIFASTGGILTLTGIGVTIIGIILTGKAGVMKDRVLPEWVEYMNNSIKELVDMYQPDILWGDVPVSPFLDTNGKPLCADHWKSKEVIAYFYNHSINPDEVVTNDRWGLDTTRAGLNSKKTFSQSLWAQYAKSWHVEDGALLGDFQTPERLH